jgi:hypothetical protein
MKDLVWNEGPSHHESLAVSLRALLATSGVDRGYEEIVVALGLAGLIVAARHEPLGSWGFFARDTNLSIVAQNYGLRLRELHPPDAAVGLTRASEFAAHFRDSYMPLIERALAHDQPVLAWCGWPPQRERLWGVISRKQGAMLIGHSLWHNGQPLPLTGPAHQVYIVEACEPLTGAPAPDALMDDAAAQTLASWDGRWARQPGLFTGQPVYDAWQDLLRRPANLAGQSLFQQHALAARTVVAARRALATWLRSIGARLDAANTRAAANWASACDRVAENLGPHESPEFARAAIDKPNGIETLCAAIERARAIESEALARLRER